MAPTLAESWQEVLTDRAECRQRLETRQRASQAAATARDQLHRAESEARDAEAHEGEARAAGVWTTGDPAPADLLRSAQEELAAARRLLEPGAGDEPPGPDAVHDAR